MLGFCPLQVVTQRPVPGQILWVIRPLVSGVQMMAPRGYAHGGRSVQAFFLGTLLWIRRSFGRNATAGFQVWGLIISRRLSRHVHQSSTWTCVIQNSRNDCGPRFAEHMQFGWRLHVGRADQGLCKSFSRLITRCSPMAVCGVMHQGALAQR